MKQRLILAAAMPAKPPFKRLSFPEAAASGSRAFAWLAATLGIVVASCWNGLGAEAASPDALRAGLARVCITPERPRWLHGYADNTRFRPFQDAQKTLVDAVCALHEDSPTRFALWDESVPFPTRESLAFPDGATDVMVHRAGVDGYNFLHDSAIVSHQGTLFAAWYNCPRAEMVGEALIRGRRSQDGGRTWSGVETIVGDVQNQGILYVPVAFLSHGGTLYAFITNMKGGPDLVHHCEVFVLDEQSNTWVSRGFIAGPFLPNCAPQRLADGNFIIAGRVAEQPGQKPTIPAVAISRGEDLQKPWNVMRLLPTGKLDGQPIHCPETTVLVEGREVTALVRRERLNSLVFFSHDNGRTWSAPCEHNFPMEASKMYAGLLSTRQRYVLCNIPGGGRRELLAVAVSRPGQKQFSKMWKLRDGADPALKSGPEWSYPCAVEADGNLHVVYTSEKHHCVLTTIPLKSLTVDPEVTATGGVPSVAGPPPAGS